MRQNHFGIVALSVHDMLTGNTDIGKLQHPRTRKTHAKVNVGRDAALNRLVSSKDVRQDLKTKTAKAAVSLDIVHAMAIIALAFSSDGGIQLNRTLLVIEAPAFVALRALLAHVGRPLVGNERVKVFPVGRLVGGRRKVQE